jgi:predicted nucleotide-binding protein (sugar kinase/HSP70/actin superfamily)
MRRRKIRECERRVKAHRENIAKYCIDIVSHSIMGNGFLNTAQVILEIEERTDKWDCIS